MGFHLSCASAFQKCCRGRDTLKTNYCMSSTNDFFAITHATKFMRVRRVKRSSVFLQTRITYSNVHNIMVNTVCSEQYIRYKVKKY